MKHCKGGIGLRLYMQRIHISTPYREIEAIIEQRGQTHQRHPHMQTKETTEPTTRKSCLS
jgi:hypothetical protein